MAFSLDSKPTPSLVTPPVSAATLDESQPGDVLGSFTAFLRRTKTLREGLVAQFFGENGTDADQLALFNFSRFLETQVRLRMWVIKDSQGQLVLNAQGEHQALTPFVATVKNSRSTRDGMLGQFFAANGPDADAANELNASKLVDAMVLVQVIKGATDTDVVAADTTPTSELQAAAKRLTPLEERKLQQQQKVAGKAWEMLLAHGFFRKEVLWKALGGEPVYREWLTHQRCCHPGDAPCQHVPVEAYTIPDPTLRYPYVPLCREHAEQWRSGMVNLQGRSASPMAFLQTEHAANLQRWAQVRLRDVLQVPSGYDPTSSAIYRFAFDRQLTNILPGAFVALLPTT
jgi:hypothetical protein